MTPGEEFDAALVERYQDFNLDHFCALADALTQYDDGFRALELLKLLPGHMRQQIPPKVKKLRTEIERAVWTPAGYQESVVDTKGTYDDAMWAWKNLARARLVEHEVKLANQAGLTPHIVDQGPGHYWLPLGLLADGYRFTYKPVCMDVVQAEIVRPYLGELLAKKPEPGAPVFYVSFELIEHVLNTKELCFESLRSSPKTPDAVFISTPHGCFDCRSQPWRERGIGHLRTYTQAEFVTEMQTQFSYCDRWQMHLDGPILMAVGFSHAVPWREKPEG